MAEKLRSRWRLILAFAGTIVASSLVTALWRDARIARARADQPAGVDGAYVMSAYFVDGQNPTNGFVVLNTRSGRVANCVANWQGKKEARCHDWSSWVKLP